jgi:hypothetical protein
LGLFSAMIGLMLILFGLGQTVFFETYDFNFIPIIFSFFFFLPCGFWVYYLCTPDKKEAEERRRIFIERRNRRKPTLFNELVENAKKANEPPPKKIRVLAHVRKKDYPIIACTMKDFCELVENATGLPIERQLLRFNDEDIIIKHLNMKLEDDFGVRENNRIYVYNKGGYFTRDSPIKKNQRELNILQQINAMEEKQKEEENNRYDPGVFDIITRSIRSASGRYSGSMDRNNTFNRPKQSTEGRNSYSRESVSRDSISRDSIGGRSSYSRQSTNVYNGNRDSLPTVRTSLQV